MRRIFADSFYWIALLNPNDGGHGAASAASRALQQDVLVTTHEVLCEVLGHFSAHGSFTRQSAATFVRSILSDPTIEVRPQSEGTFLTGLALFEARPVKEYSLVDCISMAAMRAEGIAEILTHDIHFTQEGFAILL